MEKKVDRTNRKFTSRMQARLLLVFCVVTLLLVGLMGRLIFIMQTDGDRYAKQVLSRQTYVSSVLPYKRGDIIDRNGTVLAQSELQYRLILDPKLLLENEDCISITLASLKKSFGIETDTVQAILDEEPNKQYVIVQKNLKYDVVKSFKDTMSKNGDIIGVWFEEEYVRTYPFNSLASDLIGFTSADNTGYFGIEEYYNDILNGTNGREYGYYDSELDIERIVKKAVNGDSIVSTIDANVQRIIQEKIIEFNTENGSKSIGILVMDPNNGDIIAMASNQEYDLNSPRSLESIYTKSEIKAMTDEQKTTTLNSLWKNDVISSGFEPGSTFKPLTIAAALDEDLVSDNSTYLCDGGEIKDGRRIKCSHVHGKITLGQAIMYSCNDVLMQVVEQVGKDLFYKYEKSFGMGMKTGIDLPGEETGLILSTDDLGESGLATSSFGQSTTTTMIQMAAAFSSVVNGGYYYQPHVMKKIVSDSGSMIKEFDKILVRQTISEQTSELLQKYLYQTVEAGTAKGAQVEGYSIGGKTGTAEKLPRGEGKYVVSFLGCAPAINPEMVIYVVIDEPNVKEQSSTVATAFAGEILNEILPVLGIFPDGEIDYLLPTLTPTPTPSQGNTAEDINNTIGDESNTQETANTGEEENDTAASNENSTNGDNTQTGNSTENIENTTQDEFNINPID
ncbi:MAG: penicillin-binding protein 2 [Herbinix sp.]|nr:penicillin-binding protein 2 [Herbinix sp.]